LIWYAPPQFAVITLFRICCALLASAIAFPWSALGQAPPAPSAPSSQVRQIEVGFSLASLYDIDPARSSIGAEFYVWTTQNSPARNSAGIWEKNFDPLDSFVFLDSKEQQVVFKAHRETNGVQWNLRRYRATFSNDWNLAFFPFDKHEVKFQMREGVDLGQGFVLVPDLRNSGVNPRLIVPGWNISGFKIALEDVTFPTTFGNPAGQTPENFSWLTASVVMKRSAFLMFTRLMSGAYVSLAAALFVSLLKTNQLPQVSARIIVQINCLFGAILSSRAMDAVLGREEQFTLTQFLHVIVYFMIFASMAITIRSRLLVERNEEARAVAFERGWTLKLAIVFIALNVILITIAALSPVEAAPLSAVFR